MMMTQHYPTVKNTIQLLLWLILIMFLFFFAFVILAIATGWVKSRQLADLFVIYPQLLGIINLAAIGLMVIWGYKKTKTSFGKVFPFRPVPGSIFLPIGLVMIGLAILLSDLDNLLRLVLNTPPDQNDPLVQLFSSNNTWGLVFLLVFVAPLTEEFLFRGVILTGFLNNYPASKAVWVSALFFGIFHLNIFQIPGAFVGGLVLAWLVVKTGSLWPSLYGHALMNGLPILLLQVLKLEIPGFTFQMENKILFQPLWLDGLGLALLGLGIWLLWPRLKEKLECPPELLREEPQVDAVPVEPAENLAEASPARSGKQGLAALIMGVISMLALTGGLILSVYAVKNFSQSLTALGGLILILGFLVCLVGVGFGIVGVIKKSQLPMAWVGIILNGLYLLLVIGMFIIGFASMNSGHVFEMTK